MPLSVPQDLRGVLRFTGLMEEPATALESRSLRKPGVGFITRSPIAIARRGGSPTLVGMEEESRLSEIAVKAEGVADVEGLHDDETGAVGEAPGLVSTTQEEPQPPLMVLGANPEKFHALRLPEEPRQALDRVRASPPSEQIVRLCHHVVRG